mgnify:CR=1 FL=1
MDIVIFILLIISIMINYCLYKKLESAIEKLSKERRKHLKYKTELNIDSSLDRFEKLGKDYLPNEEVYDGIAGGDR